MYLSKSSKPRFTSLPCWLTGLICCALASSASAQMFMDGTIQTIPSLTTFQTWAGPPEVNNMEGIKVTAFFSASPPETRTWAGPPFAAPGGGVNGVDGDWFLRNLTAGFSHTYANPWELSYDGGPKGNLVAFEIDGFGKFADDPLDIEGNTAFDTNTPDPGTPGSLEGNTFNVIGNTHDVKYTYSDAIQLAGSAGPERDIYRRLRAEFLGKTDAKWSQPPVQELGENVHSDFDWRRVMETTDRQAAADDFISDGRPITGVRWWGSYFNSEEQPQPDPVNQNLVPAIEEGYAITFFESGGQGDAPGQLLGTYLAPINVVDIANTGLIGWDTHEVWEYTVDLDQTFLEHVNGPAEPEAFFEEEGVEYWISIAAWDGHVIDPITGEAEDTGDDVHEEPWWGWHTTPSVGENPNFLNDPVFAASVSMGPNGEWIYDPWNNPPLEHSEPDLITNFAFELLTTDPDLIGLDGTPLNNFMSFVADTDTVVAPEPAGLPTTCMGVILLGSLRRRRR